MRVAVLASLTLLGIFFCACEAKRNVLVFGGNGFMGASTVEKLIGLGDNVTIVNRGNWYWDSYTRIRPYVTTIHCDRKKELSECKELLELIATDEYTIDHIIDFSAYSGYEVTEACKTLTAGKLSGLYILVSTDSVYDVSEKKYTDKSKETDAVRPKSAQDREKINKHHDYGHRKLEAEEALMHQRQEGTPGFPFVILRLPDVVGVRDTTYRWWMYQLWLKLAPKITERPVQIPHYLANYPISLVYVEDVTNTIVQIMTFGPQIKDQAINLAYPDVFTLEQILRDIQTELGEQTEFDITAANNHETVYLYPTNRRGPIDVSKAENLISWKPTPWQDVVKDTVSFYENAMKDEKFYTQREEIIQIVKSQLYEGHVSEYFKQLEELYDIDLKHWSHIRDEL